MSLRTPLGKVRGLGSAKHGLAHWWAQRLTAVALIPLSIWFIASLVSLTSMEYLEITDWMKSPMNSTLLILLIIALYHHAQLGMQVVIEDYIHIDWQKLSSLLIVKFLALFCALISILSVLKVFLGL